MIGISVEVTNPNIAASDLLSEDESVWFHHVLMGDMKISLRNHDVTIKNQPLLWVVGNIIFTIKDLLFVRNKPSLIGLISEEEIYISIDDGDIVIDDRENGVSDREGLTEFCSKIGDIQRDLYGKIIKSVPAIEEKWSHNNWWPVSSYKLEMLDRR